MEEPHNSGFHVCMLSSQRERREIEIWRYSTLPDCRTTLLLLGLLVERLSLLPFLQPYGNHFGTFWPQK